VYNGLSLHRATITSGENNLAKGRIAAAHERHSLSPILYNKPPNEPPFRLQKLRLPMGRYGPPSNTWFLGPTGVHFPNGISIGSAVFAGLTIVTDRPTDHHV